MKNLLKSTSKLGAYSTMAASFLYLQQEVDAQTIYTDLIPDHVLTSTGPMDTMHLDVTGDNITDFIFNASFFYTSYASGTNFYHIAISGQNGDKIAYTFQSTNFYTVANAFWLNTNADMAKPINFAAPINNALNFTPYAKVFNEDCFPGVYSSVPDYCWTRGLANNQIKYLGFRIKTGVLKYYGWMRVYVQNIPATYGGHATSITVMDYAVNSIPNSTILAGDVFIICIPPGSLGTAGIAPYAAKIKWTPVEYADFYQVQYRPVGGVWQTRVVPAAKTSTKLTGLTCSTPYEWQVSANCGGPAITDYCPVQTFTTSVCRVGEITDLTEEEVTIYSNASQLYINIDAEIANSIPLRVFNNLGQVVFERDITDAQNTFDLQIPSGIYTVALTTESNVISKSIAIVQ